MQERIFNYFPQPQTKDLDLFFYVMAIQIIGSSMVSEIVVDV